MLLCIFHQILLHISNFTLPNFSIKVLIDDNFKEIIVSLLKSLKCPFVIEFEKETRVAINFEESRDLLLILGWIVQISGLFDRYHEKFLEKIAENLEFKENFNASGLESNNPNSSEFFSESSSKLKLSSIIDENEIIECYNKLSKKFQKLFTLLQYKEKTLTKLQTQMSLQKMNMKLNELFMMKNEKNFSLILDRLDQINTSLEKEKENLKHEELFWLWMESIIDIDKKELSSDPFYGFSDRKETLNLKGAKVSFKGMETLFQDLKELNEKYQIHKEKFVKFQCLWETKKKQIGDKKELVEQMKVDSMKVINEFEKKFLSFDKMHIMLGKNAAETFLASEILALFPHDEKILEDFEGKNKLEIDGTMKKMMEEDEILKIELKEKIRIMFNLMKETFIVFPDLK